MKGPPLPSSSNERGEGANFEGAGEREGEAAEEGIFVKVPSDLMTPGWMCLKKLRFMDSKSLMLNFCTRSGVITDSVVSQLSAYSRFTAGVLWSCAKWSPEESYR